MKAAKPRPPVAARLMEARIGAGYVTNKNFANENGIAEGTYSGHEAGTRNIDLDTVRRYAALLNVRAAWLAWGEGPMKRNDAQPEAMDQAALADRVAQLAQTLNTLLAHQPAEDGYVGIPPIARKLADVIERAGLSQVTSKSDPTSASQP